MGRKKKHTEENGVSSKLKDSLSSVRDETVQAVLAVVFFVIGVVLVMAVFFKAGAVGGFLFGKELSDGSASIGVLKLLFGYGYYVLCLFFFMLSFSFIRNLKRNFALIQTIGSFLFFLSALGLIAIMSKDGGGLIGNYIASPLIGLFEVYATSIILVALLIISFLITFDASLEINFFKSLKNLFSRTKSPEEVGAEKEVAPVKAVSAPIEPEDELKKTGVISKMFEPKRAEEELEAFTPMKPRSISLKPFIAPPLSLLEKDKGKPGVGDMKANANLIKRTLQNFGIAVEMDEVSIGPSITRYALKPAEGVKLSRILALQNNLELALAAHPVRIEAPIPGKSLVGIEIPNTTKTTVGLGTLLSEPEWQGSDKPLLVSLGKGISGKSQFVNIAKTPHMLIAGATGSGKSVTIHAIVNSLLFRNPPESMKLIMIDPKRVELTLYNKIPHLLTPVITDAKKAILALKWAGKEMDRRYDVLAEHSVQNIETYHKTILEPELKKHRDKGAAASDEIPETMPYIVIFIDELADIMQAFPRELESSIVRLAQMSRAVGMHLILSTQRPSVNVITGLIKANVPTRIALQVASQIDSRTILDSAGAEKLLGAGDMLFQSGEMSKPVRLQSAFISETEVKRVVQHLVESYADEIPEQIDFTGGADAGKQSIFDAEMDDGDGDALYEEAREVVIRAGKASTSFLQRKLGVGYARAARIVDMLEERGVVGPGSGSKPREVLEKNDSSPDDHGITGDETSDES
jgi:S-DNA-T family DNA segregation ATPase FtsK/SpoIIIE